VQEACKKLDKTRFQYQNLQYGILNQKFVLLWWYFWCHISALPRTSFGAIRCEP